MTFDEAAKLVMERCEKLACYSEEVGQLTRRFATPELQEAKEAVASWMQAAGMTVHYDHVGNLIGRYEGEIAGANTLLLGSHLDTVRDAGKYDGSLGILVALACVERLKQRQIRLPFAIEVLAFVDEEGVRYHSTYLGSKAVVGSFEVDRLGSVDEAGITMAEAIQAAGGNPDPDYLKIARWKREELLGYCEVHIEQGPVLERSDLPVTVVSAIAGQSRIAIEIQGEAGHAGTVPMEMRRDALCAAAEFVLAVEELARHQAGIIATVGKLEVKPGASNVIPGEVILSLDVRHQDDATRVEAIQQLYRRASQICEERQVILGWQIVQENSAVICTPQFVNLLGRAINEEGYPVKVLASGAGHDGVVLSQLMDIAMLFVRCRNGISHHPSESVREDDVAVAIKVLERFIDLLGEKE